ncbi:MAG: S-ribosylhomocysteine lyase [Clostridia bacterium]|nr:S-ribosylhomocysteine lyase [Clostridia bacterium]
MKQIESFKADHDKIVPGMYISRVDGDLITYDMRTRKPNGGEYMDNITMHTVEHMFATYVRSSDIGEKIIYFGPMGCQTGFYLIVKDTEPVIVLDVVKKTLKQIINHKGEVFGASQKECGNYKNLALAPCVEECKKYLEVLNSREVDFKYE